MLTFRRFLNEHTPDTNWKKVGLTVYYLQTYGEEDVVIPSDIRTLFNMNEVPMSESAIAAHLHNLEEEGLILERERRGQNGYFLTPEGIKRFERLTGERLDSPPPEEANGDDLMEHYENLYEEAQVIQEEVQAAREASRKWRRRTWVWRVGSFIAGAGLGAVVSLAL